MWSAKWIISGLLILLVILVVDFLLLRNSIYKIFGIGFKQYFENILPEKSPENVGKTLNEIHTTDVALKDHSFNNLMLVSINASHTFKLRELLKKGNEANFIYIDVHDVQNILNGEQPNDQFIGSQDIFKTLLGNEKLALINRAVRQKPIEGESLTVYIDHFEFAHNDLSINRLKLQILQSLVDNSLIKVVLSSQISPDKIYNFYQDSIKRFIVKFNAQKSLEIQNAINALKADYKKWLRLLGGFYRLTIPFEVFENEIAANKDLDKAELAHGVYLNKLSRSLPKSYGKIDDEDLILHIQEVAYPYYFSIWNAISDEERYIVYDIAKDKFTNTNNVDTILDLMNKGILVYDHYLRLMNESFANFVLSKVDSDEALSKELDKRKKGKWNTASSVLIILIISLVIFISFGRVGLLDDINALIGSLAAMLALVLRLGGIFTFNKAKEF
ncbi:MAG: hypothetical protein AAGA64_06530 [Bacteroidota bacterium]